MESFFERLCYFGIGYAMAMLIVNIEGATVHPLINFITLVLSVVVLIHIVIQKNPNP